MVIGIIGENCTGKSTLAQTIQQSVGGEIITGKDYLRLAKSESMAALMFRKKLHAALLGDNVIYVISEKEHLAFLPEGSVKILVTAELDTIKERFRERMRGSLPKGVEMMLEKKHGMFDSGDYDFIFHSEKDDLTAICSEICKRI